MEHKNSFHIKKLNHQSGFGWAEMMRAESDCASCACAEECADTSVYQDAFDDAPKAAEPAAEEPQTEAEEEPEAEED